MTVSYGSDVENKNTMMFTQEAVPFDSVEDAWFWFINAQQARNDGARTVSGVGNVKRPCEPVDILKILDTLYRKRRLVRDHLLVLRHYGRRMMPPEKSRVKEKRAYYIWTEAMDRLEEVMEAKGIVRANSWVSRYQDQMPPAQSDFFNYAGGRA